MPRSIDLTGCTPIEASVLFTSLCIFPNSETNRNNYLTNFIVHDLAVIEKRRSANEPYPDRLRFDKYLNSLQPLIDKYASYNKIYEVFTSRNFSKFSENTRKRINMFLMSGNILDIALGHNTGVGGSARIFLEALQEKEGVLKYFSDEFILEIFRQEENITNNAWQEFKDVAHLSAAMLHLTPLRVNIESVTSPVTTEPFLLHGFIKQSAHNFPATIELFFGIAEAYRRAGVKYKPKGSSRKEFISDSTSWQVKPFGELPHLVFPNLPGN